MPMNIGLFVSRVLGPKCTSLIPAQLWLVMGTAMGTFFVLFSRGETKGFEGQLREEVDLVQKVW